jgi:Putative phage holin Dp-1
LLKNSTYDRLKFLALVALPALGTLYFAVAGIWGLPWADKIVGTITAVDAFLGALVHVAANVAKAPADGQLIVDKSEPGKTLFTIAMDTALHEIENLDHVTLKVQPEGGAVPVGNTGGR